MENDNNKQPLGSRSILSAFTSATKVGEVGRSYVLSRHHHVERPKHSLDYARVYINPNNRDDGRAMAILA